MTSENRSLLIGNCSIFCSNACNCGGRSAVGASAEAVGIAMLAPAPAARRPAVTRVTGLRLLI